MLRSDGNRPLLLVVIVDVGPLVIIVVVGVFKSRFVRYRFLIVLLRCVWYADKLIIGRENIFEIGVKYSFVVETVTSGQSREIQVYVSETSVLVL